jgi:hypothetical protein
VISSGHQSQGKPGRRFERGFTRILAADVIRVFFFFSFNAFCTEGIVIRVLQDKHFMRRPLQSVFARMYCPQVGQLNLNSVFVGVASVFMCAV